MESPQFPQPRSSNLVVPGLLALVVLGAAIAALLHFTPHRTADLAVTQTKVYQAHTVFRSDTILLKKENAQDDLYILTTLRIEDRLKLPLFLKDLTATLTDASGGTMTTNAAEQTDLGPILTTFPALKSLASPPLLRDTQISSGQSAEGMVLLQFPITQDVWNHRQSATLTVDFYHQPPQTITIPKP